MDRGPPTPDASDGEDGEENLHSLTTDDLTQRIRLRPTNPELYLVRGVRLYYLGRFHDAIADYSRAIELDPTYVLAYNNRGTAYMELGQFQDSLLDFSRVVKLSPESPVGYFNRALLHESQDQFEPALRNLTDGIPFAKDFSLLYRRASIYETMKEDDLAIADYAQIILDAQRKGEDGGTGGDENEAIFKRGMIYFRLRREAEAREDLVRVVRKLKYRRLAAKALRKMDQDRREKEGEEE